MKFILNNNEHEQTILVRGQLMHSVHTEKSFAGADDGKMRAANESYVLKMNIIFILHFINVSGRKFCCTSIKRCF